MPAASDPYERHSTSWAWAVVAATATQSAATAVPASIFFRMSRLEGRVVIVASANRSVSSPRWDYSHRDENTGPRDDTRTSAPTSRFPSLRRLRTAVQAIDEPPHVRAGIRPMWRVVAGMAFIEGAGALLRGPEGLNKRPRRHNPLPVWCRRTRSLDNTRNCLPFLVSDSSSNPWRTRSARSTRSATSGSGSIRSMSVMPGRPPAAGRGSLPAARGAAGDRPCMRHAPVRCCGKSA